MLLSHLLKNNGDFKISFTGYTLIFGQEKFKGHPKNPISVLFRQTTFLARFLWLPSTDMNIEMVTLGRELHEEQ